MSNPNNAREASMSNVQTQETILASLAEKPAEVVEETKQDEQQTEQKPGKKSAQERIAELANKRREAENRADEATKRAAELEARVKALETQAPTQETNPKPARMSFTNDEEYIEALTDWKAQDALIKRERQQAEARMNAEIEEINFSYQRSLEAAQEKYEDFVEVVSAATTNIPDFLVMAIKESPLGADLTYYLSRHKDEAEKFVNMRPVKAIKYLTELEKDLSSEDVIETPVTKAAPATKKPPEPLAPLSGNTMYSPNQPKTFDEYKARRLAMKKR